MTSNKKETEYSSSIKASRAKSIGTTSEFVDYKTGRMVTCLSQGEKKFWYILRWNDDVLDIKEQYPLDDELVDKIYIQLFGENSINTEIESNKHLTTDFFVTLRNGEHRAFQIKPNENSISNPHDLKRLQVEQLYFKSLGIQWNLIYSDDINQAYFDNIQRAVRYYDVSKAHDKVSKFQHLVATKQINDIDLQAGPIDWKKSADEYFVRSGENDD